MGGALWLLGALPQWYFSTILQPLAAGPLSLVPALGTVCLLLGSLLGLGRRDLKLGLFLIPVALSQLLVGTAGALIGRIPGDISNALLLLFLGVQVLLAGWLVYILEDSRKAALALSFFSVSYALFAAFIAGMAFSNVRI